MLPPLSITPPEPLPSRPFHEYSQRGDHSRNPSQRLAPVASRRELAPRLPFAQFCSTDCTKSCHPPVDALHSIENKSDRLAIFSLTQILKGVQQDRSLTVS
jgi:hypothetical protein